MFLLSAAHARVKGLGLGFRVRGPRFGINVSMALWPRRFQDDPAAKGLGVHVCV